MATFNVGVFQALNQRDVVYGEGDDAYKGWFPPHDYAPLTGMIYVGYKPTEPVPTKKWGHRKSWINQDLDTLNIGEPGDSLRGDDGFVTDEAIPLITAAYREERGRLIERIVDYASSKKFFVDPKEVPGFTEADGNPARIHVTPDMVREAAERVWPSSPAWRGYGHHNRFRITPLGEAGRVALGLESLNIQRVTLPEDEDPEEAMTSDNVRSDARPLTEYEQWQIATRLHRRGRILVEADMRVLGLDPRGKGRTRCQRIYQHAVLAVKYPDLRLPERVKDIEPKRVAEYEKKNGLPEGEIIPYKRLNAGAARWLFVSDEEYERNYASKGKEAPSEAKKVEAAGLRGAALAPLEEAVEMVEEYLQLVRTDVARVATKSIGVAQFQQLLGSFNGGTIAFKILEALVAGSIGRTMGALRQANRLEEKVKEQEGQEGSGEGNEEE